MPISVCTVVLRCRRLDRANHHRTERITDMTVQPNIVLVHGAWADGSCWSARHRAPSGRRLYRHGPAVPRVLAGSGRRPAPPGAGPPGRPGHRRRALLRRADHDRPRHQRAERRRPGLHRGLRARRGRVDRRAPVDGSRPPRRSRTWTSTPTASPGCQKTTSSSTSRPMSTRSGRGSCTPCSSPWPSAPSRT